MKNKNRRWTIEEKDLFMSYAFADDSPSIRENIEFARYKLYEEGAHQEFKPRSIDACIHMFCKLKANYTI